MIFPRAPPFLPAKYLSTSSSPSSSPSQIPRKALTPTTLIKLGLTPSIKSLNLLLSFLLNSHKTHLLLHLFSQITPNSIQVNSQTRSLVARCLLESYQLLEAREIIWHTKKFDFVPRKGLWDSIIQCLCYDGDDPEGALSLLNQCIEDCGIFPSVRTFRSLVLKFSRQGKMERACEVLELMRSEKFGYPFDSFVCSCVISGFCRIGKPELGLGFYEQVGKDTGLQPSLVVCTAVVDALCKEGRIDGACDFICAMEDKGMVFDAVLYSSWICGYLKEGLLMEGLRKHRMMVENEIMPDVVSYTNLIDGFCKEGSVEKVVGFFGEMEKKGIKPNLITYSVLLQGFCMRDKLEEALLILKRIEESGLVLDEFAYSIVINGLCRRGEFDRVFGLLDEMGRKGIQAGSVTYNTVINALCKADKIKEADDMSRGFAGDNFTYSILLNAYGKEVDVDAVTETKRRVEEANISLDVVTYNVLIKALVMVGKIEDACAVFREMPGKGVAANLVTYSTMIDGLCNAGKMDQAIAVFEEYKSTLPHLDGICHACIIRGLCAEHRVEMALEVFRELIETNIVPNSKTYRKLIKVHFREGNGEAVLNFIHAIDKAEPGLLTSICNDALIFLCKKQCSAAGLAACIFMRRRCLAITSKSYYVLLKCLIRGGDKLITELIMCDWVKVNGPFGTRMTNILSLYLCKKNIEEAMNFLANLNYKDMKLSVLTTAIDALKKEGRAEDALNFLREAGENGAPIDVVVYSIVVDGLCKEGHLEEALDLCASMRRMGTVPNIVVYNCVINSMCRHGCFVEALRIFDSLESNLVIPTVITYATLVGALAREGFLEDAEQIFRRMVLKGITPNTRIYNSLVYGYSSFGLMDKALESFLELRESGLQPDPFTISAVINGYYQKGDTQGAYGFFIEYKRNGFSPDFLGYLILLEGLFIKRRLKEARDVLTDMLQCSEIVGLIVRAGKEHGLESLDSLLNLLCEQGRIQEAICVLNEVGSEVFPSWRSNNNSRTKQLKHLEKMGSLQTNLADKISGGRSNITNVLEVPRLSSPYLSADVADMDHGLCNTNNEKDLDIGDCEYLYGKSLPHNFDSYYSIIASLCSEGDLQRANTVAQTMISNLGNSC